MAEELQNLATSGVPRLQSMFEDFTVPCKNSYTFDLASNCVCQCQCPYYGTYCENEKVCTGSNYLNMENCECESIASLCTGDPCSSRGSCVTTDTAPFYECTCDPGFQGVDCEIDIDECASNPCVNGECAMPNPGMYSSKMGKT